MVILKIANKNCGEIVQVTYRSQGIVVWSTKAKIRGRFFQIQLIEEEEEMRQDRAATEMKLSVTEMPFDLFLRRRFLQMIGFYSKFHCCRLQLQTSSYSYNFCCCRRRRLLQPVFVIYDLLIAGYFKLESDFQSHA